MKALVRLAIFVLIVHAFVRFVPPYWNHNQFKTDLKQVSYQWGSPNDEEVMEHVLATAAKHNVPITREHVSVHRIRDHILVDIAYTVLIEWVPTVKKPWDFEAHLDAWKLEPPKNPSR